MTTTDLLHVVIRSEQDVFAARRQVRQLGAALGLEGQDQIRAAAALSEVGRRLLTELGPVTVEFTLVCPETEGDVQSRGGDPMLSVRATATGPANDDLVDGVAVTRRLMDPWHIEYDESSTSVVMGRRLPHQAAALTKEEIAAIRVAVLALTAGTPMEELAEHNRQLLATLEQVQSHRDELIELNAELTETNKGVVALYTELSVELEATNRGVVALYAELDQRSEQLRAASEAKSRFLANVSHELRSPVTSIVGLTRLLRHASSDPLTNEQARQLELIDVSARGLLGLVNQLLDMAKAESGRIEPMLEPTDLKSIFDTLRGTLRAVPRSEATRLVVAEPANIPTLVTDPILLTQVLRNLLTNGLKFTESGEVALTAAYDDENARVVLTVSDTGIGIAAAELERIFEEFYQVRGPHQATAPGTGLGLPYARWLVRALGGSIAVASTPGEGSTFTVLLPVKPDDTDDRSAGS
jgi:signal transduction histidine kinase